MTDNDHQAAAENLALLYAKVVRLHTGGDTSTISEREARQLAESLSFVLRLEDETALEELATEDPFDLFQRRQSELQEKVDKALRTWKAICLTMPDIRNVALRDTLASIGNIKHHYDTYFAAHEVPCEIEYQLSKPIDDRKLKGIDYVQAWLGLLWDETQWIGQFTSESCIAVLESCCPDYRGLHVNLYDLLAPREEQLARHA